MIRVLSVLAMVGLAQPVLAETAKEVDCGYQADVVAAVQAARLARVKERAVPDHVAATDPDWPEKYSVVVQLVTPWVYEMKMRELKVADLGAAWKELCLQQ